jgi:hypothetical protein
LDIAPADSEIAHPVADAEPADIEVAPAVARSGGPLEFDRVVPPSGNLMVCQRQFWMGTHRAGMVAHIWADCDLIHVLIADVRVKTVRSHLSVNDLAALARQGAVAAGPPPLPPIEHGDAIEVERTVNRGGGVSLGQHIVLAAEILAGRRVGIRIEPATLMFYDLDTRELLRTRKNPLRPEEARRLRGARPAGPPPRPSIEPVGVQRRASNSGVIMITGQKVALGRLHKHQTVTVTVSETTLAIELPDGETKVVRRTTTQPVRSIKGQRPRIGRA